MPSLPAQFPAQGCTAWPLPECDFCIPTPEKNVQKQISRLKRKKEVCLGRPCWSREVGSDDPKGGPFQSDMFRDSVAAGCLGNMPNYTA